MVEFNQAPPLQSQVSNKSVRIETCPGGEDACPGTVKVSSDGFGANDTMRLASAVLCAEGNEGPMCGVGACETVWPAYGNGEPPSGVLEPIMYGGSRTTTIPTSTALYERQGVYPRAVDTTVLSIPLGFTSHTTIAAV
jgi:hypothetical protein